MAVGAAHGLKLAGFHAINACRTEKGYRHWGHDIGIEDTPWRPAGLHLCLRQARRLHRPRGGDAEGTRHTEQAVAAVQGSPIPPSCWCTRSRSSPTGSRWASPPRACSATRVGASLGMGYVKRPHPITPDWIATTPFEIGVGDRRVPAQAQLGAWYDPKGERIKA